MQRTAEAAPVTIVSHRPLRDGKGRGMSGKARLRAVLHSALYYKGIGLVGGKQAVIARRYLAKAVSTRV